MDVLYTDYSKAFDKVSHPKLIYKLEKYGICGNLLLWIKDFLCGRIQRVVLGESFSSWEEVSSGVPQGSVLGPILFIIYINDLPEILDCKCKMYADDNKIFNIWKSSQDKRINQNKLQNDIVKLERWSSDWEIELNRKKCKIVKFGKEKDMTSYYM